MINATESLSYVFLFKYFIEILYFFLQNKEKFKLTRQTNIFLNKRAKRKAVKSNLRE